MQWLVAIEEESELKSPFVIRVHATGVHATIWFQETEEEEKIKETTQQRDFKEIILQTENVLHYEYLLLPSISITTFAKLATLIWDTPLTLMVGKAILEGKKVFFFQEGIPGKIKGYIPGITMLIELYRGRLESFGLVPITEEEWWQQVAKSNPDRPLNNKPKIKQVITQDDIRQIHAKGEKKIYYNGGSIITPLARDVARELGIELLEKDGTF